MWVAFVLYNDTVDSGTGTHNLSHGPAVIPLQTATLKKEKAGHYETAYPLPNDTASHTPRRRQRQLLHTEMANSGHSWGMYAVNEHCLRGQGLDTGPIIIEWLGLRKQRTDVGKYAFVNSTIKSWNQLRAGLQASFPCKPNTFRERVKNVVTGKEIKVGTECK